MGKANFTEEFKTDAIKQITECGYSVAEVSQRLGGSTVLSTAKAIFVFRYNQTIIPVDNPV